MKTLYYGGPIRTMETDAPAGALLVENGVIAAVGALETLRARAGNAAEIDLEGRTLLPGFIDAHSTFPARRMHCCRRRSEKKPTLPASRRHSRALLRITVCRRGHGWSARAMTKPRSLSSAIRRAPCSTAFPRRIPL